MAADSSARRPAWILTCEHAGNRIPRRYARLFRGAGAELASHRGWDPGALSLARLLSRELGVPLLATPWSRLLVEANRSLRHPRLWSERTRALPAAEREQILERYWFPHRKAVEAAVLRALRGAPLALHVAVHSFTPRLAGEVRNADVGLLYDSRRAREAELARRWGAEMRVRSPGLRVRYNYPYRGRDDGLTTSLRRQHAPERYLGFELEVNQALLASARWRSIGRSLALSLRSALERTPQTRSRPNADAR
jgi:predicted N-formylglutamate amidohydrolase